MKNLTNKLMIAAAALLAAGVASGQSLQVNIPFAFQANGKSMPAGAYMLNLRGPAGTVSFQGNWKTSAVMTRPVSHIESKDETPRLVFLCAHGACSLIQAWPGYQQLGLTFEAPKVDRNEEASLTVIHLRPDAAE